MSSTAESELVARCREEEIALVSSGVFGAIESAAAGAIVERDGGESAAWLRLPKDTVGSRVEQALERHLGELDFQFKRHMRTVGDFLDGVAEVRSRIRKVRDRSGDQDPPAR